MKLNIGDTIRNNRKQVNMTQDQLAEKLGVSYQSVSRWENGSTYPDIELLPALAKIFKISTDELLGIPDEKKDQEAKDTLVMLARATYEEPVDINKIIDLLRDIRRNHLSSRHFWHFWLSSKKDTYRIPEILSEIRMTVETILEGESSIFKKNEAIKYMSQIEDDEHIEKFLERYASEFDLTKNALLYDRYRVHGEWDRAEPFRQLYLYNHIDQLIGNSGLWQNYSKEPDLQELILANDLKLGLLHQLCDQMPDEKYPVSGNGEIDFWIEPRMWMGFRKACYLSGTGDIENAFVVLEDTVSLLEKAMKITTPIELRCTSPWLDSIVWTAEESWHPSSGSPAMATIEEHNIWIHNDDWCYVLYPSWYRDILTARSGWEWFDPIRNDPRYTTYLDRLNNLVITRAKKES